MLRIAAEKCRFPPHGQVTDDTSVLTLKSLVLEPLLRWEEGRVRPGLFSHWAHDGTGRRWTFTIREGAAFHDGTPCEADHVLHYVTTILTARDTFGMPWSYARYLARARITAPARDTVRVENPEPFADILDVFSEFYIPLPGTSHVGTGPWRITAYDHEREATLARVAGPGALRMTAIPRAEDRLQALRDGEADVAMNLERVHDRFDVPPGLTWLTAPNTLSVMCYLNELSGPFASLEARLAINHALDARIIVDDIHHGFGTPAATIVSPHHLGARAAALSPIRHDPDRARRLFDAARITAPLTIRTPLHMPEKARETCEAIRFFLDQVGVPAVLDVQPDRPEYAREVGRKKVGDLAIFDSSPHSTFRVLNDKISAVSRGPWWQGHDDPDLEPLIATANRAVEDDAREAAYGACLRRLHANPPWLYLFHPVDVAAARPEAGPLSLDARGVLGVG